MVLSDIFLSLLKWGLIFFQNVLFLMSFLYTVVYLEGHILSIYS